MVKRYIFTYTAIVARRPSLIVARVWAGEIMSYEKPSRLRVRRDGFFVLASWRRLSAAAGVRVYQ